MFTATKGKVLPTTVTGSWPRPTWYHANTGGERFAHCMTDIEFRESFQDATSCVISDQERAGLDIITDGEIRRESYSNRLATALGGIDIDNPGTAMDRTGHANPVPRIAGRIERVRPAELRDAEFLVANTDRRTKITLPGPFTMTQQAQNDFYDSDEEAALD